MKKLLSGLLGIMLTACLAACGSYGKDTVNNNNIECFNSKTNML